MESQSFSNPAGWAVTLAGLALALLSAMTPHFGAGYLLRIDILLAGLLPYLVYAIAVPLLAGTVTTLVGIILIALHTGLVISERFMNGADYSNGLIYILPLIMSVAVLPLVVIALLKTDTHQAVKKP